MRTVYFVCPQRATYHSFPRKIFNTLKEAQKLKKEYEERRAPTDIEEHTLKAGEYYWAVYITEPDFYMGSQPSDHYAAYFKAQTEEGARRKGQEYIRAWNIEDKKIRKIVKII